MKPWSLWTLFVVVVLAMAEATFKTPTNSLDVNALRSCPPCQQQQPSTNRGRGGSSDSSDSSDDSNSNDSSSSDDSGDRRRRPSGNAGHASAGPSCPLIRASQCASGRVVNCGCCSVCLVHLGVGDQCGYQNNAECAPPSQCVNYVCTSNQVYGIDQIQLF